MTGRRYVAGFLAAVLMLPLVSCSSEKVQNSEEPGKAVEQPGEYRWVPEYVALDSDSLSYGRTQIYGDTLYFVNYSWDEENMTSTSVISSISLADGSQGEDIVISRSGTDDGEGEEQPYRDLTWFMPDGNGNFYTVESIYHWDESTFTSSQEFFFCKRDGKGAVLSERDLTQNIADGEDVYLQGAALDGSGRAYLAFSGGMVHLLDADGNYSGSIQAGGADDWINAIGTGRDGKVYITQYDRTANGYGMALKELDFENKAIGATFGNYPNSYNSNGMTVGTEYDFLVNDGKSLYGYDLATQKAEKMFDWLDSDINGEYVISMTVLEDGRMAAFIRDWNTNASELALLTKKNISEIVEKETLILGIFYMDQDIQTAVVNFNKKSDKWHISVRTYYDDTNAGSMEEYQKLYQDAVARLNNDITSANCPDLLALGQINAEQYAKKGVFEDLNPYLEAGSKIKKEDYFENVLEAYTYDNVLITIPRNFSINTLAGKASDLGDKSGWTMEEMMEYLDAHPDAEPFDRGTKDSIIDIMLTYNQAAFVDWTSGKCSFDSDEFVKLLEFANRFPKEAHWSADEDPTPLKLQSGEVLLYQDSIYWFDTIQVTAAMFDEEINYIGYPNARGENGTYLYLYPDSCIAMTSKSTHKDGAWEFLEDYFTTQDNRYHFGLSTNKKFLEQKAKEEVAIEYLKDENGELVLDDEGNPIELGGGSSWGWGSWNYQLHHTTQEEVDILMELLEKAKPAKDCDQEILKIITEEAGSYFEGQKSARDVAEVIQRRVQIYMDENS